MRFARAVLPAQVVAVTTRSSFAALPAGLEGARRLGIPASVAGYSLFASGASIVAVTPAGSLHVVDQRTGASQWQRRIVERFSGRPAINGTHVMAGSAGKEFLDISLTTGQVKAARKVAHSVTAITVGEDGAVFVGDERGNISMFDKAAVKRKWSFRTGGEITQIFTTGDFVIAASNDNFIYALLASNGHVEWKKRLGGRVLHVSPVHEIYLAAAGSNDNAALLVDIKTGRTVGQVALDEGDALTRAPLYSNGLLRMLTARSLLGYSFSECAPKQQSGLRAP